MAFKFSTVEAATASDFIKPGVYTAKITDVVLGKSKTKGTASLDVTFTFDNGLKYTENFFLVENALGRIQYLYQAWAGKKLEKDFNTADEVVAFFKKTFNSKAPTKVIIVGGETNQGKTYARLPFTSFVTDELEEGEFTEGDENWKKYVQVGNRTTAASGKKNGILNDSDDDAPAATAASTKKGGKDTAPVTTDAGDEEDGDTPW